MKSLSAYLSPETENSWQRRVMARSKRAAGLVLVLALAACGGRDSGPVHFTDDQEGTKRLFAGGFEDIAAFYIDDISTEQLALSGLRSLAWIDPALEIQEEGRALSLIFEGEEATRLLKPGKSDTLGWGAVTAEIIATGRTISPEMAEAEAEAVYEAVFDGVVTQLDGFSRYASREMARENRASRDGFGGIGVRIRLVEDGVHVLSVMENTPAEVGGMKKDDIIIAIDGTPVAGLTQREAVGRLRGEIRSTVVLTIDREGEAGALDLEIVRAHIIPQTTKYETRGNAAYIQVSGFNKDTTRSLRNRVKSAISRQGNDLSGIILDLRDNPGGLLDQSVSVSNLFMTEGPVVTTRGRHPNSFQAFDADGQDVAQGLPIVVLINASSASASEIVAAALQDAGRAVVVGSVSYGKGTVQTLVRLANQGELTLTWARFHAPSGYALDKRGILPDICTSKSDLDLESILSGLDRGEGIADRHLRELDIPSNDQDSVNKLRASCPAQEEAEDLDIEVARTLLKRPDLYALALQGQPDTAALQSAFNSNSAQ